MAPTCGPGCIAAYGITRGLAEQHTFVYSRNVPVWTAQGVIAHRYLIGQLRGQAT